MSKMERELVSSLKDHEMAFLLTTVKAIMKQSLPPIEIGSVSLPETHEGDVIETPRWIAEVMAQMGFAEIQEESFDIELFKALSRERIQESSQISTLKIDFYHRMKRHTDLMKSLAERDESLRKDYEKFSASAYDLIALRTSKLLYLVGSSPLSSDLEKKLTPEEKELFNSIRSIIENWKRTILEGE
ncbi:MAG: hypothetical protein ACUVWK_06015 [Nitrososphaerales archaeon]